jgi:hypothetical protein
MPAWIFRNLTANQALKRRCILPDVVEHSRCSSAFVERSIGGACGLRELLRKASHLAQMFRQGLPRIGVSPEHILTIALIALLWRILPGIHE